MSMTREERSAWVRKTVKDVRRRARGGDYEPCVNFERIKQLAGIHYTINERAEWRRAFEARQEGGKVAVVRSGMDCDCTQYKRVTIIDTPSSVVEWLDEEWKHREWLDGPESVWLEPPSWWPDGNHYASRDRALEAFEDGHPHRVTWGEL